MAAKPKKKSSNPAILRANIVLGAAAAEDDDSLLFACFAESDQYRDLIDPDSGRFLVKGRTGSGKTALLRKLEADQDNVIRIDPKHLCLQHISNSDIIRFLERHEVKLEPFFDVIWRHTFATELLRKRFDISDQAASKNWFNNVLINLQPKKKRSLEYLRDLGVELWPEFEHRITAVTKKVEDDIRLGLTATAPGEAALSLDLGGRRSSAEEKTEVQRRIQTVLGQSQLSSLQGVIDFLAQDVFNDPQRTYYVIMDDLDTFIVDDVIRLKLLRSMIDSVKKFKGIPAVKFCIAVRTDLLEEIFLHGADRGFQQEKYEDSILALSWTRDNLFALLELRMREVFRRRYTRDNVRFYDVFSKDVQKTPTREYLLDRTLMRPRDVILFANECFAKAAGKASVTATSVRDAEADYSHKRLVSLTNEWGALHPLIQLYCKPLRGGAAHFEISAVTDAMTDELVQDLACADRAEEDVLGKRALAIFEDAVDLIRWDFCREWVCLLYKVGVLGVKLSSSASVMWSQKDRQLLLPEELTAHARLQVHPMFHRTLGIRTAST